ncbi:MAG: type II toxin-antitoxin system HicB family antitoxin, partial [Desulfitobacteriaceae bacterium]|nr:type II toxin-antitoxin system HicB family antitoxin [Desulfitobacteriaceae bacterium]
EIPDLPGCISQGETVEEAVSMIEDAKRGWLEVALEQGAEIPEPTAMVSADYSGKFNVRVPKSLHKSLVENAKTENVSLNQLVVYHLSKSIGHRGI